MAELLSAQSWDIRRPPNGQMYRQQEYTLDPLLKRALAKASKSGLGRGYPEAILTIRDNAGACVAIEAKPHSNEIELAVAEACRYADFLEDVGQKALAIGLAGTADDTFELRVLKKKGGKWLHVTYSGQPISWIPSPADTTLLLTSKVSELHPSVPDPAILAGRADEINRLLRESGIKDEFRPGVTGAIMLALWAAKGNIRRQPAFILQDINSACSQAFNVASQPSLAHSIRVEEANSKLAAKAPRVVEILDRLNVSTLSAEHDYLGQLYETFFRYTGGNTIGQYFTPRHITRMMADICQISKADIVLDPACGTGGFLIAAMNSLMAHHKLKREEAIKIVRSQLIGFEEEPVTAALCVANMILRGDGSTSVHRADTFVTPGYPTGKASVALMNPPFPHKSTDRPVTDFVERALDGLANRGRLAVILPTSMLVKSSYASWRTNILTKHTLLAVCQLPDELFQPYASATTSFVVIEKGVPHSPGKDSIFVRLEHDGLTLKKGTRVSRSDQLNDIPSAVDAILNNRATPGFSGTGRITSGAEWASGAYIPSAIRDMDALEATIDVQLRRLVSFYSRYAPEVVNQRRGIEGGDLSLESYEDMVGAARRENARALGGAAGTVGSRYSIYYGMKELHSREGLSDGRSLIISPTESYNGCYGWLEFPRLIAPPFITVAQTGSIGESFVQLEPCAVNDDCLILLPRAAAWGDLAQLALTSAVIHMEKWRFSYGRKLTPSRIVDFVIPQSAALLDRIRNRLNELLAVARQSLIAYGLRENEKIPFRTADYPTLSSTTPANHDE